MSVGCMVAFVGWKLGNEYDTQTTRHMSTRMKEAQAAGHASIRAMGVKGRIMGKFGRVEKSLELLWPFQRGLAATGAAY